MTTGVSARRASGGRAPSPLQYAWRPPQMNIQSVMKMCCNHIGINSSAHSCKYSITEYTEVPGEAICWHIMQANPNPTGEAHSAPRSSKNRSLLTSHRLRRTIPKIPIYQTLVLSVLLYMHQRHRHYSSQTSRHWKPFT